MTEAGAWQVPDVETVRAQVERWRCTRASSRSRMPEPLWHAAVALCEEHTVHSVAQYLGLGYDRLRRRVVEAELERVRAQAPDVENEFVELRLAPEPSADPRAVVAYEIELQRADGARLVVRSDATLDLHELTRTFLEGGR